MNKKNVFKMVIVVSIVIMIFLSFQNVFAALNSGYTDISESTVDDEALKESSLLSSILRPIAFVIYCVGQVIELLLTKFAGLLTNQEVFPWADLIIFNEVPLLDINFIDPGANTLMADLNRVVINPLYFTILSIAIAFFSVAVLIMALKILFTAIAEEKAKYKQQLVNWLVGIVLLFTLHYFMAFIFYLNENLVRVASTIATEKISSANTSVATLSELYKTEAVESYETEMEIPVSDGTGATYNIVTTQVTTDIHIEFCIMYTIFVGQSILFFFVYLKRLFFVVILALLGPIVVVYDFFSKAVLQ